MWVVDRLEYGVVVKTTPPKTEEKAKMFKDEMAHKYPYLSFAVRNEDDSPIDPYRETEYDTPDTKREKREA